MATSEHTRPLLTIPQAAERLNLSTTTVRRRIWDGELQAVRLGLGPQAPVRIDPTELERYVHEGSRLQPPPAEGATTMASRRSQGGLEDSHAA